MERVPQEVAEFLTACKDGKQDIVTSMLDVDGTVALQVDASGRNGLHFAAFFGQLAVIRSLVSHKADMSAIDYDYMTPLMLAAKKGETPAVTCLLECNADVNQRVTDSSITAVHHAAAVNDVSMIEFLIQHNAQLDCTPTEKGSVLHWAVTSGRIDSVAHFLDPPYNLPLSTADVNGGTVLHHAVSSDHEELTLFLLERQADPNARARGGCTPLHLATEVGTRDEIVLHLLTFGAELLPDDAGDTPLTNATQRNKKNIIKALEKKAAGGYELTAQKRAESMERFKAQGNKAFQQGEYVKSCKFYTLSISFVPTNHVLFSNRSASYHNLRRLPLALADACQCVRINPQWPKGYFRKGSVLMLLGLLEEARASFQAGLGYDAKNADLLSAMDVLNLRIQKASQPN
jgi:ankyrin repeat protein